MNTMKRGQIATEYLLLVGIAFLAIIPIFYYALTSSSQNIKMNEAADFVNTIAKTADIVYALGPGSQDYVKVTLPGGVESISFEGNEITLKLKIFRSISDVFAESKTNLTGSLPITSGSRYVYAKTLDNGTVEIGEY